MRKATNQIYQKKYYVTYQITIKLRGSKLQISPLLLASR